MDDHEKPPAYNYGAIPQGGPNYVAPPPYSSPDSGPKQQQAYPPPQPIAPTGTTTIITQPAAIYVGHMIFREQPVSMVCPQCQAHIVSATSYNDGTLTWILAGGLCIFGYGRSLYVIIAVIASRA
ncbi:hypothetical protein QZH41_013291 [Actinostola sp. cb2023]|nr:hypothetical protein QZH41_013291 [Actinostola sp. cb2023]